MITMRCLIIVVLLTFATSAHAEDLAIWGALGGAGEGFSRGAATMQAYYLQRELMLQQHRQEMDRLERQERLLREREDAAYARELERQRAAFAIEEAQQQLEAERQALAAEREALQEERIQRQQEVARTRLAQLHPDWREIVGSEGSGTAYRQWLATEPVMYQRLLAEIWDPEVIGASIERFKATQ